MKTVNFLFSKILRILLVFLLFFIWVRYYEKSLVWAVVYTSVLTLAFDFLLTFITKKKDLKASMKKGEIAKAEGYCNFFVFNGNAVAVNFFYELLSKNFSSTKKANYILFENGEEKNVLFPYYIYNKMSIQDLVFVYEKVKKLTINKIIICTNEVDPKTKELVAKLPIKFVILNKYETYESIMKKYDYFPDSLLNIDDNPKLNFKTFLAYSLNKKRAKGYIFSSIILLISSLFVRVTIYYLVFSSILLLMAIFSYTNTLYNKKISTDIF
ncbi:MAG: hypothetical protein PHQ62_03990 [Clostridia bacterium]|nr:hypothetical protein [Clostridia bacterium]